MLFIGKSKLISKLIVATGVTFVLLACKSSDNSFKSEQHTLTSPDGLVELNLSWASKTSPQLSVIFEGKSVVLPSDIDLVSSKSAIAEHDLELVSERSVDETAPLTWGQFEDLKVDTTKLDLNLSINKLKA
ncbi:glycoside hydrolase family 97 N-terminal domain-containing protein [Psychrosphaera sp. G1-22]|uniref:Glycoside hydrolase family 97 N-terminal domain-containing protein n=1 Tax=Psychrosphaera algicola TaxID=3023714 RepID=A0ABT5FBA2_9GAMM|nr:glycoside hydrolase family 97 N-terminal domain-containing protein [Psychrosphaera sp. G1-22]MDC2888826.1 glycoside hydrolase family 97 N-terminal domain-containing protein [Psychrosphaera sp. G1-22]